jgi:O-antigen/teichoic acid export membrane protein
VAAASAGIAAVLGLLWIAAWPWLGARLGPSLEVGWGDLMLIALALPAAALCNTFKQVFAVAGTSAQFSIAVMVGAAGGFATTMVFLFVLQAGLLALLAGFFATQVSTAALSVLFARGIVGWPARAWIIEFWRKGRSAAGNTILEAGRSVLESATLTKAVGVHDLGLYSHSRLYGSFLTQIANGVSSGIWAASLAEVRAQGSNFEITRKTWAVVHLGVAVVGIFMADFGRELISVLTNGKFTDAAVLVPIWIVYVLVQCCAKSAGAILYARGDAAFIYGARSASLVIGAAALVIFVPLYGVWAAAAIALFELLGYQLAIWAKVRKLAPVQPLDRWVVVGAAFVLVSAAICEILSPSIMVRLVLFAAAVSALGLLARATIGWALRILLGYARTMRR